MKKIALLITMAISISYAYSQTQQQNLEKYWRYRDRLRERFVVVSQNVMEEGVNIPCGYLFDDGWAKFGDGNYNMSHYLSLLSTELYLLKKNGQDYSETLKELLYAMMALERLDLYSEYYWRKSAGKNYLNIPTINDINGMHLRDDITDAFWAKYKSHFGASSFISQFTSGNFPQEEISQDVMYHNIEGLSLVAKLVGSESIANISVNYHSSIIPTSLEPHPVVEYLKKHSIMNQDETVVDFSKWAKDFIRRYIECFQSDKDDVTKFGIINHWVLRNTVTNNPVQQGSGIDDGFWDAWAFYNYGLIAVGKEMLGGDGGRKKDGFAASKKVFEQILDKGANESFENAIMSVLAPGSNKLWSRLTQDVLTVGAYELNVASAKQIAKWIDNWVDPSNDDYKVRSLACTGNVLGGDTYAKLISRRSYDPLGTGQKTIYEHLPLMNLALYDLDCKNMKYGNDYKSERKIYEDLLNSAPACGPNNWKGYAKDWSTASRLIWPESNGKEDPGEFCGMDYMVLYNLYCIAFSREQYVTTTNNTSTINTVVISKPITSNNVTNSAPCVTLLPGFEASGSSNYTAEAVALPTDFVDGTQYRKIDYPDCGCSTTMATAAKEKTKVYMAKPKIENDSVLAEDEPIELFAEEPLDISEFGEPCSNEQGIMVTPNPATNVMEVCVGNGFAMPIRVEAISLAGVLVDAVESNEPCCQFNVSQWPEGMYVVRVISGDKVSSVNVMVKH